MDCEIRSVIRFLSAKDLRAIDICREICAVYEIRKIAAEMCMMTKGVGDIRSLMTDGLVQKVDQTVKGNRRFTITPSSDDFPRVCRSTVYEIVTKRLNYTKLCSRRVRKT